MADAAAENAPEGGQDPENGEKDEDKKDGWCKTCCFGLLDFLALISRWVIACCRGMAYCVKSTCYPVKENMFYVVDSVEQCMRPYKKKLPIDSVPIFRYDSMGSSVKMNGFSY
mmetsp:Transcript_11582/g.26316  ORF Transcript_11582/g.26316 Transcript_11582/m.26316 type:complete len:113 (-) Transcript_11582:266-604(-)